MIKAILFDMDGVLVNSEPMIRACAQEAAAELGFLISDETYITWMGLPSAQLRDAIRHSMGSKFPMETFYEEYKKRWVGKVKLGKLLANPGIKTLLEVLNIPDMFGIDCFSDILQNSGYSVNNVQTSKF